MGDFFFSPILFFAKIFYWPNFLHDSFLTTFLRQKFSWPKRLWTKSVWDWYISRPNLLGPKLFWTKKWKKCWLQTIILVQKIVVFKIFSFRNFLSFHKKFGPIKVFWSKNLSPKNFYQKNVEREEYCQSKMKFWPKNVGLKKKYWLIHFYQKNTFDEIFFTKWNFQISSNSKSVHCSFGGIKKTIDFVPNIKHFVLDDSLMF